MLLTPIEAQFKKNYPSIFIHLTKLPVCCHYLSFAPPFITGMKTGRLIYIISLILHSVKVGKFLEQLNC